MMRGIITRLRSAVAATPPPDAALVMEATGNPINGDVPYTGRDIQSRAFFNTPIDRIFHIISIIIWLLMMAMVSIPLIAPLYSGHAINTPSAACN
jgi:hypothetical protein